ncbi:MAG: YiiX/YebB-like N1pC/P60 family cysteine hydrolase [Crocinitomicaceae bacterium]
MPNPSPTLDDGFFYDMKFTLLAILFLFSILSCKQHNHQDGTPGLSYHPTIIYPSIPDSIQRILKNGDIILRKGDGPLSFHLSRSTGEDYTHCGIIFKHNSRWGVIHTLGTDASTKGINGVQTQSLRAFAKQSADSILFICRPIFKENIGDSIVISAKRYLKQKVPFDYGFSMISTDKFYCSELLYYIFKDVNNEKNIFDIKIKNESYILMFSTFFNAKNFIPIYNLKSND